MSRSKRTGAVLGITLALGLGLVPGIAGTASAHPGGDSVKHGPSSGHLPPKQESVRLVGEAKVTPRPSTTPLPAGVTNPLEGRVADVNVFGDYAYLAAFREPTCENGGVFVVDVRNPAKPVELPGSFIPSAPGTYVGEGVQVVEIGARDVLLFNQEPCNAAVTPGGGFSLVDVTDPRNPVPLTISGGDVSGNGTNDAAVTTPHSAHSVYAWNDDGKTYLVAVDNIEEKDIDLFDISNPAAPVLVSETSFVDDPRVVQANPPNGDSQFLHDLVVKEINGRQTMLASYWDNGYIQLDVENPAAPVFLRDTDFAATEPFAAELGLPEGFEPEGNAHQAEYSPDGQLFIGTDEDFGPFRVVAKITAGANSGQQFTATQGTGTPRVSDTRSVTGPTVAGGEGCTAAAIPPGGATQTVVLERGTCTFQVKYDNAVTAGYGAVVVFNSKTGCDGVVNPQVTGTTIPFVFVTRTDGLKILGQTVANPCTQDAPAIGTAGSSIDIRAVFDGWGYVHLYDARTNESIDEFAIPESLDKSKASGFGDLSVHEVAMDPKVPGRAYLSYYSGGFRVIEYDRTGIRQIGAYVDPQGSNIWGVQTWTSPTTGQDYVLASDRDFGLQIFQYDAAAPVVTAAITPNPVPAGAGTITVSGTVTDAATATVTVSLRDSAGTTRPAQTVVVSQTGDRRYSVTFDATGLAAGTITSTATAVDGAGNTASVTVTATRTAAGPPVTPPPSPPAGGCATPATVQLGRTVIIATGSSSVSVRAAAGQRVDLFAYTRPSTTYRVVRTGVTGADGTVAFAPLRPPANTRLYAQVRGCTANPARTSVVLNVRTALSLFVERNGVRDYTFSGDSLPARPGGLLVTLYRVTANGSQVLTAQTRADARTGEWSIDRRFTGTGRFGFVVRSGQDLQNAAGASNVRRTLIF